MKKYDLSSLNEEQRKALLETEGAVLVTAGAGSGKTRLLTHRVAYLIEQKHVSPFNILAITFTNKAAGEMKSRTCEMIEGAENIWISTFHAMCARILRRDIDALEGYNKNFTIYSESDTEKIVKQVCEERNISDDILKKKFAFHVSNYKNGTLSLEDYVRERSEDEDMRKIGLLIEAYEETLKKNNALDFDDLLRKTFILFKRFPQILEYYASRFRYILVDEFQDTNLVQYDLVKMLASIHGNVFVVGDEDQCIYSWRGANFQNIFNFKKDFSNCKVFKLEQNYRSTAGILNLANNVIKNNTSRLDKKMWTDKPEGDRPSLYNAYDERDEALYVAKTIERLRLQGYEYQDIAVLMRMNALSRSFEEAFLSYNIPHRIFGGFKFYERVEIRNVIAYLRLFVNKKDDISLERIINFPKRGMGEGGISKLRALAGEGSMLEAIEANLIENDNVLSKKLSDFREIYLNLQEKTSLKLSVFVESVIKQFKILDCYNPKDEEDLNRILNITSLVSSVKEYEQLNPQSTLAEFLESITLKTDNDEIGLGGAVTIATVHGVKGLEFKAVFVVGLEDGVFPIIRTMKKAEEEEERRLLYVALTRAEEKLFLSYATKRYLYRESQYQTPSRFIRELGLMQYESVRPVRQELTSVSNAHMKNYDFDSGSFETNKTSEQFFNKSTFLKREEKKEEKLGKDVSIYKVGQVVSHPKFGDGEIVDITPDGLVGDIIFEDFGKKSLMLELAPLKIKED